MNCGARYVDAQVHDLEAHALEHGHDHVLVDVVKISGHGSDHRLGLPLVAGFHLMRTPTLHRLAHGAGGDHHLWQEELTARVLFADNGHRRDQRFGHNLHRVRALGKRGSDRPRPQRMPKSLTWIKAGGRLDRYFFVTSGQPLCPLPPGRLHNRRSLHAPGVRLATRTGVTDPVDEWTFSTSR